MGMLQRKLLQSWRGPIFGSTNLSEVAARVAPLPAAADGGARAGGVLAACPCTASPKQREDEDKFPFPHASQCQCLHHAVAAESDSKKSPA